jgi:hypothetical protein
MKDFGEEIKINRFKLEEECERHVSLYHYYSKARAETKAELDDANDKLKLASAEVDQYLRGHWDEPSYGKQTENALKNVLETHPRITKLKDSIRDIQKNLYILDASTFALDHRKSMLDNLVTLLVKGFYSAPNGGKRKDANDEVVDEIRSKINKKK